MPGIVEILGGMSDGSPRICNFDQNENGMRINYDSCILSISCWQGLYGQNVVSSYSKAVDSAHSSVRVHSSRQSNDIIGAHGKNAWTTKKKHE